MDTIIGTSGPTLLSSGQTLWTGLAAIMVVWTGVRIALSGNFQPWEVIKLIIGLWIPWAMLNFYATPLPPPADAYDLYDLMTSGAGALSTLFTATAMLIFVGSCLVLLYCITYAQVLWAQIAIAILIFLGPLFIPWLLFEPLSFLFWGWFRSLIVFSLYGALAGAVMRVFMGVGLGYVTTFSNTTLTLDATAMGGWVLIVLPLFVAGVLASLKVGELAGMLVTGSGSGGSGLTGLAMMAASGGKTAGAAGAAKVVK